MDKPRPCPPLQVKPECVAAIELAVKEGIEDGLSELHAKTDQIYKRMFVDNGKDSIQTVLGELRSRQREMKAQIVIQWSVIAGFALAVAGIIVSLVQSGIIKIATHVVSNGG